MIQKRPPGCAIYARTSKGDFRQPNSIAVQIGHKKSLVESLGMEMIPERYNGRADILEPESNRHPQPGLFIDRDQSAYRKPLHKRIAGRILLDSLQRGDVLIVHRLDRLSRSVTDFCNIFNYLQARSIRLIVCHPRMDMGTAEGRALATVMAALAEWESARKSERIKEALAAKAGKEICLRGLNRVKLEDIGSDWRPTEKAPKLSQKIPGKIHLYLRCSHRESAESGLGLLAQLKIITEYAESLMEENPNLIMGETFTDSVQSAFSCPLRMRLGGKTLDATAKKGDHVIFAIHDRAFRSVRDMANTIPEWLDRGVDVHFAASRQRMSDPAGRMLAGIMVQFAEFESQLTSDRTREAKHIAASAGQFQGGMVPIFWKIVRFDRMKRLVLDRERISQFRLIKFYTDHLKWGRREALERIEILIARREFRVALPQCGVDKWSVLNRQLHQNYPRDIRGRAFPHWSRRQHERALKFYDEVIEKWREIVAKRRMLNQGTEATEMNSFCTDGNPLMSTNV